ncbi:metallopeptidase TldD-related protein [Stetteria hydrogenophila]
MTIESLLDSAARALEGAVDEYALLAVDGYELMVKFYQRGVSVVQSWRHLELGVYAAVDGRVGVFWLDSGDPARAAREAVEALRRSERSPLYAPLPGPSGEPLSSVDPKLREAAVTGDASFIIEDLGLREARGRAAGMARVDYARVRLATSAGADLGYEYTGFDGYARFIEGREASGQWSWTSTRYDIDAAREALERARELAVECSRLPRERLEPGEYRVLLSPMVAGNLAGEVAEAASAGAVLLGFSFLQAAKPGDEVASEAFTLLDRPRDTGLPAFRGFDDEGVATRDKAVIEKGVLRGFLHNTKTARLMGAESTGNAGWIIPKPFNLEVAPGDLGEDELLEALGDGVYLTNNWYTRFHNHAEGTFSTVSRDAAFIVRRGEPVACTARVRIADSMPRILRSVEAAGRRQWSIQWWEVEHPTRTPFILLSRARLTSAG